MRTIDTKIYLDHLHLQIDLADFLLTNIATSSFPGDTRQWIKEGPFNLGNPRGYSRRM